LPSVPGFQSSRHGVRLCRTCAQVHKMNLGLKTRGSGAYRRASAVTMFDALREVDNGVAVRLWVVPGAKDTKIDGYDNWKKSIKFKTTEPPERGKANRSILAFFSSLTGRKTALQSGARSKQKEVLVLGATLKEVSDALKQT